MLTTNSSSAFEPENSLASLAEPVGYCRARADQIPSVQFVDRLAAYTCYNTDQMVAQASTLLKRLISRAPVPSSGAS